MRKIRTLLGMNQQEFAVWLGAAIATISSWERGITEPRLTLEQFLKLDQALRRVGHCLADFTLKAAGN